MTVTHEPLSLLPAEGWRATYLALGEEGEEGDYFERPLIAWAVCRVCVKYDEEGDANYLHGYVSFGDSTECVEADTEFFWEYLAPGVDSPTPTEVANMLRVRAMFSRSAERKGS